MEYFDQCDGGFRQKIEVQAVKPGQIIKSPAGEYLLIVDDPYLHLKSNQHVTTVCLRTNNLYTINRSCLVEVIAYDLMIL